jgi:hypothetical protein
MRVQPTFILFIFTSFLFSSLLKANEFNPFIMRNNTPIGLTTSSYYLFNPQTKDVKQSDCPKSEKYCIGILTFHDGSIYNGEISYGKPNGKGIMKWSDGSYYIGSFLKGELNGFGEYHFRNGNRYEGGWANNRMNGQGAFIWANGTEYIGTFKDDQMHGSGSVVLNNNESYSGEWSNNLPHGKGKFTQNNGSIYTGSVKKGLRHGNGIISWENGDTISGNWAAGKFDGDVKFQFQNGDKLITEWKDGQIANQSSYISNKGKIIKGELEEIENALLYNTYDDTFASNIQFTYYSIGLEFETNNQYKTATQYLRLASNIESDENLMNESIGLILQELSEKQKSGMANLNKDENY